MKSGLTRRRSIVLVLIGIFVILVGAFCAVLLQASRSLSHLAQEAKWMIHVNGVEVSPYHDSQGGEHSPSASRLLEGRYTLRPGQSLAVTLPIGDLTVVPGRGRQVLVSVTLSGHSVTTDKAQAYLRKTLLMPTTTDSQLFALGLGLPGMGGSLSGVHMIVTVPAGLKASFTDHLGSVRIVGGIYDSLAVTDHVGNVNVTAQVTHTMRVSDNLGNIRVLCIPGTQTRITDNMGNIDMTFTAGRTWHIRARTNLGEIVNDDTHDLTLVKSSGSLAATPVTVLDNMGNITLRQLTHR
ncbi:MAG: hypothetical protein OWT28_02835 [Firmicutes bacterium]|nr:hypothetical protein [Bacillota bacterium]